MTPPTLGLYINTKDTHLEIICRQGSGRVLELMLLATHSSLFLLSYWFRAVFRCPRQLRMAMYRLLAIFAVIATLCPLNMALQIYQTRIPNAGNRGADPMVPSKIPSPFGVANQ